MDPELRDMLLVCADRAEELGQGVARDVLRCLAGMEDGTSLPWFIHRLQDVAGFRELGRAAMRPQYADEPARDLGYRNYPVDR